MGVLDELFGDISPEGKDSSSGEQERSGRDEAAHEEIASFLESAEDAPPEKRPDLKALRQSLRDPEEEHGDDDEDDEEVSGQIAALYEVSDERGDDEDVDFDALRRAMASTKDEEDEHEDTPDEASQRLNWLVDFVAEEGEKTQDAATEASVEQPGDEDAVSRQAMNEMAGIFRDEILMRLLQREAINVAQAVRAVREKDEHPDRPLWDVLANLPDVDSAAVFAEAARAEGIAEADVTDDQPTTSFLRNVLEVLPAPVRKQFAYLGLLPYRYEVDAEAGCQYLVVASHFPTHPYVKEFVDGLSFEVQLCYAPEATISGRIEEMEQMELAEGMDPRGRSASLIKLMQGRFREADDETPEARNHNGEEREESAGALLDNMLGSAGAHDGEQKAFDDEALLGDEVEDGEDASTNEGEPETEAARSAVPTPYEALTKGERAPDDADLPPTSHEAVTADQLEAPADMDVLTETPPQPASRREEEMLRDEVPDKANAPSSAGKANVAEPPAEPSEVEGERDEEAENEEREAASQLPSNDEGEPQGLAAEMERQRAAQQAAAQVADQDKEADLDGEEAPQEETEPSAPAVSDEALEEIKTQDRVVALLLNEGIVSAHQALRARRHQQKADAQETLWRILAAANEEDREVIYAQAADLYAFRSADLEEHALDPEFSRSVFERFDEEQQEQLLEMKVVPYQSTTDEKAGTRRLAFVSHDPTRRGAHRLLHELPVERFNLLYAPEEAVSDLIAEAFPKKNEYLQRMEEDGGMAVDLGVAHEEEESLIDEEALEAEISRSKLINLFEATLVEGVHQGASDVHIYPNANKKVEIHFRVDGRLKHWHTEDKIHPEALLAVIKDNAMNVDRFERDAAQDGFIQRKIDGALIRFRVSVLPIANASQEIRSESIVIRILDDRKVITDLSKLGLLEGAMNRFEKAINQPHGMVIMTGPTGSGKSTTLVAALHNVVTSEVNALTVEDPVEYIIDGVRQIKLNNKLTLDGALRSILRHDPDIVMVGEMRDRETAELAIKLANTGHLTFSTLHTNDAPSAISRLYKMGIEPFLLAYAINLVVAQRLIRTLCPSCKVVDDDPDYVLFQQLGFSDEEIDRTTFYKDGNDPHCSRCGGTGYVGRRAISEALYFTREIRHMIVEAEGMIEEQAIREEARKDGLLTLQDSAREIVKLGETSVQEMIRVVASEGTE